MISLDFEGSYTQCTIGSKCMHHKTLDSYIINADFTSIHSHQPRAMNQYLPKHSIAILIFCLYILILQDIEGWFMSWMSQGWLRWSQHQLKRWVITDAIERCTNSTLYVVHLHFAFSDIGAERQWVLEFALKQVPPRLKGWQRIQPCVRWKTNRHTFRNQSWSPDYKLLQGSTFQEPTV